MSKCTMVFLCAVSIFVSVYSAPEYGNDEDRRAPRFNRSALFGKTSVKRNSDHNRQRRQAWRSGSQNGYGPPYRDMFNNGYGSYNGKNSQESYDSSSSYSRSAPPPRESNHFQSGYNRESPPYGRKPWDDNYQSREGKPRDERRPPEYRRPPPFSEHQPPRDWPSSYEYEAPHSHGIIPRMGPPQEEDDYPPPSHHGLPLGRHRSPSPPDDEGPHHGPPPGGHRPPPPPDDRGPYHGPLPGGHRPPPPPDDKGPPHHGPPPRGHRPPPPPDDRGPPYHGPPPGGHRPPPPPYDKSPPHHGPPPGGHRPPPPPDDRGPPPHGFLYDRPPSRNHPSPYHHYNAPPRDDDYSPHREPPPDNHGPPPSHPPNRDYISNHNNKYDVLPPQDFHDIDGPIYGDLISSSKSIKNSVESFSSTNLDDKKNSASSINTSSSATRNLSSETRPVIGLEQTPGPPHPSTDLQEFEIDVRSNFPEDLKIIKNEPGVPLLPPFPFYQVTPVTPEKE